MNASSLSPKLKRLHSTISKLSLNDKETLKEVVQSIIFKEKNTYSTKIKEHRVDTCPYCQSKKFVKNGINKKGVQSYRCSGDSCKKFFSDSTGKSIYWIHRKDIWYEFVETMFDGQYHSIREMAKRFNISTRTAFDWRHKILKGLDLQIVDGFDGIVETDDVHYRFSQKGRRGLVKPKTRGVSNTKRGDSNESVKVLMSSDRKNTMKFDLVRIGRITASDIKYSLGDLLNSDYNILTSDAHPSIKFFAKNSGLKHETFKAKKHTRGIYHVNTVNSKAKEVKNIINGKMLGVATKYLQSYLNWYKIMQLVKKIDLEVFDSCFVNNTPWMKFKNREQNYQQFMREYSSMG